MRPSLAFLLLACSTALVSVSAAQPISVPLNPDQWVFSDRNERINPRKSLEGNGKLVKFQGRESLRLAKGFSYVRGLEFLNGTIDAEIALASDGNFVGIAFRVESDDEYEMFFFRNGIAGTIEAIQYTPGFGGMNAWQLYSYPTYTASANYVANEWIHVRVVVAGSEAKLYVNGLDEPVLTVPDLKHGYTKGSIGFWGQEGGGYVSNVKYTPDNKTYQGSVARNFLPGVLDNWEISDAFDVSEKDPYTYPGASPDSSGWKWERVPAENPGMVVIQRYRRDPNITVGRRKPLERTKGAKVVFARTTIQADRDEIRPMKIAYSDEVMVYLNSKPVYAGSNAYGSRQSDHYGRFIVGNDVIYLQLKKGPNELMLAVTEFFAGWAFLCQLMP